MVLSSGFGTKYFNLLSMSEKSGNENLFQAEKILIGTIITSLTILAFYFWAFFFYIEMKKLAYAPREYLMDISNWLDMFSQMLSLSFFIVLDYTIIFDKIIIEVQDLRIWGGAACMLMWIRMFQWMRLFTATAHFISLLSAVLSSLKVFNFMWLLVMLAFGNFFYLLN